MADNVQLPGTGQTIATKDDGNGVEFQQVAVVDKALQQVNPASDDSLNILRKILNAFLFPGWLDRSANQIRAQVTGTATVTFASNQDIRTVTNLTTFGTFPADHMQRNINIMAWSNTVRTKFS